MEPKLREPVVELSAREALARRPASGALFLDRDGVINVDKGYVHEPSNVEWCEGITSLIRLAWRRGLVPIIVTNQAGIARGYYDEERFIAFSGWIHAQLAAAAAPVLATYYCPHHPEAGLGALRVRCDCRKPGNAMIEAAIEDWGIERARSYLVGDKISDIRAAARSQLAGAILVGPDSADGVEHWGGTLRAVRSTLDAEAALTTMLSAGAPAHL